MPELPPGRGVGEMNGKQEIMMKNPIVDGHVESFESIVAYCCGSPKGDELPQVAGIDDIAIDVFNDLTAMPREVAAAYLHHQMDDENVFH